MALSLSRRRLASRRAAAVAELAICLPLFVMLVLASIEACSMMFLDHGLTIASYEGVRVAINFDGNTAEAKARANEIINARSIKNAVVSTSPANVANVERGQPVSVTVSAPCNPNMIIPPWFFGGRTLVARTTMVKE